MLAAETVTIEQLLKLKVKIVFRPLGKQLIHGAISADNTIEMDPRTRIHLAKLLLHELIHARFPLWSEYRVGLWEAQLWQEATWRHKAELIKLLAKARIWEGEGAIADDDAEGAPQPDRAGGARDTKDAGPGEVEAGPGLQRG